jgi:hypothetical protein
MVKKMGSQKKEIWHLLYSYLALLQANTLCTFCISLKAVSGQLETDRQKSQKHQPQFWNPKIIAFTDKPKGALTLDVNSSKWKYQLLHLMYVLYSVRMWFPQGFLLKDNTTDKIKLARK